MLLIKEILLFLECCLGYLRKVAIVWVALMFIGLFLLREKDLKPYIGVFSATVESYEAKMEDIIVLSPLRLI
jgi:hypothetical protein